MKKLSIGVLIPTYNGAKHLPYLLPFLVQSPLQPKILVIDSSSNDNTAAIAKEMGAEVIKISKNEFNHGLTREKGRKFLNTDIVVMMTQDAYPVSINMLSELIGPIIQQKASISYGRQLPHIGADFFESFPRNFNYGEESQIRGLEDIPTFGSYTFFCSNSCAAYLNSALDEIDGFPDVLFGEDTVVVAKLLRLNHKIAYVATAEVRHSHKYSLKQEFSRHFDIGLARKSYQHLINSGGKDTKRGLAFTKALLMKINPLLVPYALFQIGAKWLGYKIGQWSVNAPVWFKKRLSSQDYYWK